MLRHILPRRLKTLLSIIVLISLITCLLTKIPRLDIVSKHKIFWAYAVCANDYWENSTMGEGGVDENLVLAVDCSREGAGLKALGVNKKSLCPIAIKVLKSWIDAKNFLGIKLKMYGAKNFPTSCDETPEKIWREAKY